MRILTGEPKVIHVAIISADIEVNIIMNTFQTVSKTVIFFLCNTVAKFVPIMYSCQHIVRVLPKAGLFRTQSA